MMKQQHYSTTASFFFLLVLTSVVFASTGVLQEISGSRVAAAPPSDSTALNLRPIIGVLTQPAPSYLSQWGDSYLDADYIKWIEFAGGRVVPVPYDANYTVLNDIFSWVNGILYTGGGLYLGPNNTYYNASLFLYHTAQAAQGLSLLLGIEIFLLMHYVV